jgi:hypothetical protein
VKESRRSQLLDRDEDGECSSSSVSARLQHRSLAIVLLNRMSGPRPMDIASARCTIAHLPTEVLQRAFTFVPRWWTDYLQEAQGLADMCSCMYVCRAWKVRRTVSFQGGRQLMAWNV